MSYIGVQPTAGQYRKLDNISSGFNGSTTAFTTSVSGTNVTAGTAQQLLVSLGGVIQQPDTDYTVSTNTITFTTAPTSGLSFFAVLMGDALNTVSVSDGAITTAKLAGSLSVGLADGTVSAPSLYFTGDANCGIYSPSDDQLAITTNGVERVEFGTSEVVFNDGGADIDFRIEGDTNANLFFVDAGNDRVGIGTSSPSQLLEIKGANARFAVNSTTVADGGILLQGNGTTYAEIKLDASSGVLDIAEKQAAGNITFSTGTTPTERARIDSSGRLLVGTSSARDNFYNTTGEYPAVQIEGTDYNKASLALTLDVNTITAPRIVFGKTRGGSIGSNTIVQSGDQVGVLSFQGSDGTNLVDAARIQCEVDGTPGADDMPGRLVFSTTADGAASPTERMRITSDGYFKASNNSTYATASPDYHQFNQSAASQWTLGVFNRHASQPFGVTIQYSNAAPNGTTNSFLLCGDTTTDRLQVRSNGGIANYQANDVNLSDRNAKKDITPAAGTWDCIKEWEIVNYRYKDQPDDADLNLGVIAQQVAESCPEVITVFEEAKDDQPEKLGVKEQQMYWMAIKALQEAQVRIEALEAEVAALKAQ